MHNHKRRALRSSACQNSKSHRSEARKRLRAHERDRWRRDRKMRRRGKEVLQTTRKEDMTEGANKGRREGRKEEKVGQTGRQWRLLQLDTADWSSEKPSLMCSTHTAVRQTHTHTRTHCNQAHVPKSIPSTHTYKLHDLLAPASQSQWQSSHAHLGSMATSFANQRFWLFYVCVCVCIPNMHLNKIKLLTLFIS